MENKSWFCSAKKNEARLKIIAEFDKRSVRENAEDRKKDLLALEKCVTRYLVQAYFIDACHEDCKQPLKSIGICVSNKHCNLQNKERF